MSKDTLSVRISSWWHGGWAPVDLLVLGGGIASASLYDWLVVDPDKVTGWMEFWPGLTTEVLGAWISVRVIDFLIKRRELKSQARWRIVRILNYVRDLSRHLAPIPRPIELGKLEDEIRYFREKHHVKARERHLSIDERSEVDAAFANAVEFARACAEFRSVWRALEGLKRALRASEDTLYVSEERLRPFQMAYECARDSYDDLFRGGNAPEAIVLPTDVTEAGSVALPTSLLQDVCNFAENVQKLYALRTSVEAKASDLQKCLEDARANVIEEEIRFS